MNAVIAACSEYTWLTKHKRVDGTMYSCTSLGVKLGGGLGTAITGWLLAASHFDSALTVQPDSCINMLKIMYLVIPFALDAIITFLLSRMKVEEANEKLRAAADNKPLSFLLHLLFPGGIAGFLRGGWRNIIKL